MIRTLRLAVLLLAGCSRQAPAPPVAAAATSQPAGDSVFDSSACSRALAQQARLAGKSSSLKSSEVIQGIVRQLPNTGAPQSYCDRVLSAVPAINSRPPRHLTAAEVSAIEAVR